MTGEFYVTLYFCISFSCLSEGFMAREEVITAEVESQFLALISIG